MNKKTLYTAAALTAGIFITGPASADNFYFGFWGNNGGVVVGSGSGNGGYYNPRPPRYGLSQLQIRRSLKRRGYRKIRFVKRRPGAYVVLAKAPRGRKVKLWVNAYNGKILKRRRV